MNLYRLSAIQYQLQTSLSFIFIVVLYFFNSRNAKDTFVVYGFQEMITKRFIDFDTYHFVNNIITEQYVCTRLMY
jgi:hypothetical protein